MNGPKFSNLGHSTSGTWEQHSNAFMMPYGYDVTMQKQNCKKLPYWVVVNSYNFCDIWCRALILLLIIEETICIYIKRCSMNLVYFDQHFHPKQIFHSFHTLKISVDAVLIWITLINIFIQHKFFIHWKYVTHFAIFIVFQRFACHPRLSLISKITFASIIHFSWSSGNAFISGAGGLRFKSRTGQIGHSVANGSPPLRHFFEWSCVAGRNDAEMGPANSLHAPAHYSEYNESGLI